MRSESLKLWRFCDAVVPESELSLNEDELRDRGERESVLDRGEDTAESLAGSMGGWLLSVMVQRVWRLQRGGWDLSGCESILVSLENCTPPNVGIT